MASSGAVGGAGTAATDAGSAHHLDAARRVADDGARGGGGSGARYECGDSAARRTTHRCAGGCPWTRLPIWKGYCQVVSLTASDHAGLQGHELLLERQTTVHTVGGVDDERRFTWTRSPSRQGELHGGARAGSASGPYLSPVRFDDRTTDRESHAHAAGLGGVEGVEQAINTLRVQSRAGILHGDEHPARCVLPGVDAHPSRSL